MSMDKQYIVVTSTDFNEFENLVSLRLSHGYVPVGGVSVIMTGASRSDVVSGFLSGKIPSGVLCSQAMMKGLNDSVSTVDTERISG